MLMWVVALVQAAVLGSGSGAGIVAVEDENPAPEVVPVPRAEQARCAVRGTVCATVHPQGLHLVAHLKPTVGDSFIVAVFDRAHPESIALKQPQVVWDVSSHRARFLGLRIFLSPDNGFARSHTYLVRVVQVKAKERILAEGDVRVD